MTAIRVVARAVAGVIAVGWSVQVAPPAAAASDTWCTTGLGGSWDGSTGICSVSVMSVRNATMSISVALPGELLDDPTAGPAIHTYTRELVDGWRKTGQTMMRDNIAAEDYVVYSHSNAVKSIVFHEVWQTVGLTPNNAYRTFTFDLARGERLQLADLFKPGTDPLTAIPPLARPYLSDALDQAPPRHDPDTYPFTPQEWEPHPDGSGYSGNYRAFALTPDELVLYMPDSPMAHENPRPRDQLVWSMDGGVVTVHIPLATLAPILRR